MSSLPLLLTLTCRQSLRLAEAFDPSITKHCRNSLVPSQRARHELVQVAYVGKDVDMLEREIDAPRRVEAAGLQRVRYRAWGRE